VPDRAVLPEPALAAGGAVRAFLGPDIGKLSKSPDEFPWLSPFPDRLLDPAAVAESRDSIRLAFVAALQYLPPRQRAVIILREVLAFPAAEVASWLDMSVASVNSALQRARTTMAGLPEHQRPCAVEPENAELLAKYVDAFQRYDMKALIGLLREDALQTMPPLELWIQGASAITAWMTQPGPSACAGSLLVPVRANGVRAWAQYKPDPEHGGYAPWALQVHEVTGGKISRMTFFLDTERVFPLFGLQDRIFDDR
jgi:RNA polymerase sigma-70 factor, ECF subfamily